MIALQTESQLPSGKRWRFTPLFALAFALAAIVRLAPMLSTDFPLIDGGLFYTMIRDLQAANFALPAFTSYNGGAIPFAYPPLGLYAAALLQTVTGWPLERIILWLPFCASLLAVPAFYALARQLLPATTSAAAVLLFALMPESFQWQMMGGGVTRAPGFLAAILAITQSYLLFSGRGRRHLWLAILFAACTALTHPQMAWFAAFSIGLIFLARSRTLNGLRDLGLLVGGVLVLTSPWWLTVLLRHGMAPFLAATQHGWPAYAGILRLLIIGPTSEFLLPLIAFLAFLGLLRCLADGRWFMPAWALATFALDSWLPAMLATAPLALLAGSGVTRVILPLMRRESATNSAEEAIPLAASTAGQPLHRRLVLAVCAAGVIYLVLAAMLTGVARLVPLAAEEREAMAWVATRAAPGDTYLVISGDRWGEDRSAEWFPALTGQISVATVQGAEWLANDEFARRVQASEALRPCAALGATCLEKWLAETGATVTHIYVAKRTNTLDMDLPLGTVIRQADCCRPLRDTLNSDPSYALVYDGPGAAIYRRTP